LKAIAAEKARIRAKQEAEEKALAEKLDGMTIQAAAEYMREKDGKKAAEETEAREAAEEKERLEREEQEAIATKEKDEKDAEILAQKDEEQETQAEAKALE
jgi:hypothetical protein